MFHLAQGDLEAFVREYSMLGGAFIRRGATRQTPGKDVFPLKFTAVAFAGGIILCTAEDPFGPCHWGWTEASSRLLTSIPAPGHIV